MEKIKVSATTTLNFIALIIFYALNIILLIFLLNIAYRVSISHMKYTKSGRGTNSSKYMKGYPWDSPEPSLSFSCDTAHLEYDVCYLNYPTKVDPRNGVLYVIDPLKSSPPSMAWIRPYPRKGQFDAMFRTKEVTLTTAPLDEPCTVTHHSPILIFSTGGYTGNTFHDFNEGWFPLFITVYEFFRDRNVIFGIYNWKPWWLVKYAELLPHFTSYPIINLDEEKGVHCFPYGIVGLKSHGVMKVDPALFGKNPKTMSDFHAIFSQAYNSGQSRGHILPIFSSFGKPKLAFIVRRDTRKLINEKDIVQLVENLGFEVVRFAITKTTPMQDLFRLINSSHVLMGIHGSELTHVLFLRPGAIFIQIVPINCGWLADMRFGKVAQRLGINHITYEIGFNESSLRTDNFAREALLSWHDSVSFMMADTEIWNKYMNQDVEIDLSRFKSYLERAYEKARIFIINNG